MTDMLVDSAVFMGWKINARRDDWHTRFVGSDIRVMLGEIERLTEQLRAAKRDTCIPDEGEPSFTLLGRDPQAPYLVLRWAVDRARLEPSAMAKVQDAISIATRMVQYKMANPDKGLKMLSSRQIVTEEWQRAVVEFNLTPNSVTEAVVARIMERLDTNDTNETVSAQHPDAVVRER